MRSVQRGPWFGLLAALGLLVLLALTVGLDRTGWWVGGVVAVGGAVALHLALRAYDVRVLGPADVVTVTRAVLVVGVSALALGGRSTTLVVLASVALALDWVDGRVARRTRTVSELGARLDMEVDAFLVLVLSVHVEPQVGAWVLLIGLARYLLLAATFALPWLAAPMPVRRWAKAVAAVQGIALTVVAADVLPHAWSTWLLLVALGLLAVSFGHQVWWLRRQPDRAPAVRGALAVPAFVLVWFALVAPDRLSLLSPFAFLRIPLEALVLLAVLVVLPAAARRTTAVLVGLVLALLVIVKILDMGFYEALNRPFDSVIDWTYLDSAVGLVDDSVGRVAAIGAVVVVALLVLAFLVLVPLSVLHLSRLASRHRRGSLRVVAAASVAWVLCVVLGVHHDSVPVASTSAAAYTYGQVTRIPTELRDQREFAQAAATDPLHDVPSGSLLSGLRGKDVLFVFVESYGRTAVQDSWFAPGVDRVLDDGTRTLDAAGFHSRSAYLTSPTFGAISWLAHSTLQSGLWVDSQQRYDVLMTSPRLTLSRAFGSAGWRTVSDVPANTHDWPQGRFYGYDHFYDSRNVGYRGPRFGYPTMPDQYTLDAFHRLELTPGPRKPVMAEIDLITSHAPWSRTPHMIAQDAVGDGSVFEGMPEQAPSKTVIWRSPRRVQQAYAESIQYSLQSLVSFVTSYADKNTVVVFLGDHQPATVVSGENASHDVPVSIVAKDPAVLARIDGWKWQDGLNPGPSAPVLRMDRFRDRFLGAFGS